MKAIRILLAIISVSTIGFGAYKVFACNDKIFYALMVLGGLVLLVLLLTLIDPIWLLYVKHIAAPAEEKALASGNIIAANVTRGNKNLLLFNLPIAIACPYAVIGLYKETAGLINFKNIILYLFIAGCFVLALSNLVKFFARLFNPSLSPVYAQLKKYGDPAAVAMAISAEAASGTVAKLRPVFITGNWILNKTWFGMQIVSLNDLAWAYLLHTEYYKFFVIKERDAYELCLWLRDGALIRMVAFDAESVERMVSEAKKRAPWIVSGFSPELMKLWTDSRQEFLAQVESAKRK